MNPLVPTFLPLQTIEQSDDQTTRRRYRVSRSRFTAATRQVIRARYAAGASLRALAAEYGVSHETIRTIVRAQDEGNGKQTIVTGPAEFC